MAEPDLETAGYQAWQNLQPLWLTGTLAANLAAFATDLLPTFPEQGVNNHPVSNWLVQIAALAATMNPTASGDAGALEAAVQYVFRVCFMTSQLQTQSLITGAQATAVLTAYNTRFP